MTGPLAHTRRPESAFRVSCGNCGKTFATKGEKRRHKLAGCHKPERRFDTGPGAPVDDAGKFGRPQDHITPAIKARADAEWLAMDWRGRLPTGWTYREQANG